MEGTNYNHLSLCIDFSGHQKSTSIAGQRVEGLGLGVRPPYNISLAPTANTNEQQQRSNCFYGRQMKLFEKILVIPDANHDFWDEETSRLRQRRASSDLLASRKIPLSARQGGIISFTLPAFGLTSK